MKTPMQILISELKDGLEQDEIKVSPKELLQNLILRCEGLLEMEKEQMIDFAMDYVNSDSIGCLWDGDSAPELDIETSAEQYYYRTFNTKQL